MSRIEVKLGDIIAAQVDVVVNAANPKMLGGGGVDGALHRAAGPKLLEACRKVKPVNGIRCPFGESRITSAGNLNAKFVIHTVGPIYRNDKSPELTLKSAYSSACDLALENGCESIAFPAISCGAYGFPHEAAVNIALSVCRDSKYSGLSIYFYIYEKALYDLFVTSNFDCEE